MDPSNCDCNVCMCSDFEGYCMAKAWLPQSRYVIKSQYFHFFTFDCFLSLSFLVRILLIFCWTMSFFFCSGHSRTIEIPDCVQFSINTNACRGYCESYAVPSTQFLNGFKVPKPVTSVGQCCNIMETEDVNVMLSCVGGARNVTFKSATKCSCYHCKKD